MLGGRLVGRLGPDERETECGRLREKFVELRHVDLAVVLLVGLRQFDGIGLLELVADVAVSFGDVDVVPWRELEERLGFQIVDLITGDVEQDPTLQLVPSDPAGEAFGHHDVTRW